MERFMSTDTERRTYTADISAGIVDEYKTWNSLEGLSMMLVPRDDGTVEILLSRDVDHRIVYAR